MRSLLTMKTKARTIDREEKKRVGKSLLGDPGPWI